MKVALADVLWTAANKWLPVETYSCHAALASEQGKNWRASAEKFREKTMWRQLYAPSKALDFMSSLGCDPTKAALSDVYPDDDERQGVRYMWLLLAMHVAEDEGLMIEVAK